MPVEATTLNPLADNRLVSRFELFADAHDVRPDSGLVCHIVRQAPEQLRSRVSLAVGQQGEDCGFGSSEGGHGDASSTLFGLRFAIALSAPAQRETSFCCARVRFDVLGISARTDLSRAREMAALPRC